MISYKVSYTKDNTKTDVDMYIGSDDLLDLANRLKNYLSKKEFESIFKIEIESNWAK